jgi:hypothetical protein
VSNSPGKRLHVPACVIDDAQVLPGNTNKLLDRCITTQLGSGFKPQALVDDDQVLNTVAEV